MAAMMTFYICFISAVYSANALPAKGQSVENIHRDRYLNKTKPSVLIPRRLIEGAVEVIFLNVSNTEWRTEGDANGKPENFYILRYAVTSRNPRVARILNSTLIQRLVEGEYELSTIPSQTGGDSVSASLVEGNTEDIIGSSLSVKIVARSLGRTVIDVSVYGIAKDDQGQNGTGANRRARVESSSSIYPAPADSELRLMTSIDVCVIRRSLYHRLSSAFTIFVAIITIITTFLIGTQLDWKIIIKEFKRPLSLAVGVGCEFILMPLVAFALSMVVLRGNYGWQLACLAIGACPGGGHSPFWTMMLDGNLDVAVAMSFVASVAALGILPFWLFTLGRVFYAGSVTIPYLTITGSLFGLICPIFFGLAFKHFMPKMAERIGKILKLITLISFIVVGIFGCVVNSYVFVLLDWRHFICGMLLPWSGYVLTYPLSRLIFRLSHEDSVAIAVENGCLNVAVPVVLLQLSLSQPDADLSLVVPVGIVICSSWPLWIYFVYLLIRRRYSKAAMSSDSGVTLATLHGESKMVLPSQNLSAVQKDAEPTIEPTHNAP